MQASRYWQYIFNSKERHLLLGLFVTAFIIRAIGMHYGYWHGDERINDAAKVLTGQLVPGQHFYPPLLNYINGACLGLLYAIGRLIPVWHSTAEFRAQYFADPTAFYLVCRAVTAALGAAVAPLFYLIAKSLNMPKAARVSAGILGLFIPAMVLLSHFAKSDVALATSTVLVFLALLEKHKYPGSTKHDAYLGLSIALALSFKHSIALLLVPLMIGHIWLLCRTITVKKTLHSLLLTAAWLLPAWCLMNIGILLDLQNFIDYQKIQAQMSIRNDSPSAAFSAWFYWSTHNAYGVNLLCTLSFVAFPLYLNSRFSTLKQKTMLNIIWASVALVIVALTIMSGTRQHSGLWVPYFTAMQLFTALLLVDLMFSDDRTRLARTAGTALATVTLGLSIYGCLVIWKQALAEPIANQVATLVEDKYSDKRILSSFELRLPKLKEAQQDEIARHERLARKYQIELPEQAEERQIKTSAPGAVYHFGMPGVMFGLEDTDDDSLGEAIKPYAWPLQQEEWALDHWLDKGFNVFVVSNYDYFSSEQANRAFQSFYREMSQRCQRIHQFDPQKPLFLEATVTVFECM